MLNEFLFMNNVTMRWLLPLSLLLPLITLSLLSYNKTKVSSVDVAANADDDVDAAVTEAVCQWPLLRSETPRGNRLRLAPKHP